jgi:hypothetical protein
MSSPDRHFVQIADALRETNPWTNNEWLCRPDIVAALRAQLAAHDREQAPPAWPALIEAPIGVDKTGAEPIRSNDTYVTWSN